ncbi:hypothetical protein B0H14DRAFT_2655999 [Mycena olivaceomarginata]|nr:hypothetical protein B0H14DRAFT_2655999 [Mycena olivaceomarginata]
MYTQFSRIFSLTLLILNGSVFASFQTAFRDWRTHDSGFLIISYIEGCGVGIDSYEHSFHLMSGIHASEHDLGIVCQGTTVPIHEAMGQPNRPAKHSEATPNGVELSQYPAFRRVVHLHPAGKLLVAAKVVFKVLKVGFGVDVLFEETITKHADVKYGLPLDSRSESGKGSNDAHLVFDWSKPLHPDTGVYDDTSDPKKLGEGTHDSLGRVVCCNGNSGFETAKLKIDVSALAATLVLGLKVDRCKPQNPSVLNLGLFLNVEPGVEAGLALSAQFKYVQKSGNWDVATACKPVVSFPQVTSLSAYIEPYVAIYISAALVFRPSFKLSATIQNAADGNQRDSPDPTNQDCVHCSVYVEGVLQTTGPP